MRFVAGSLVILALLRALPVVAADAPPAGRRLGLAKPLVLEPGREVYGRAPALATVTPLAEILRAPARFADRPVRVEGTVGGVCQRKGCWMMLRDGDSEVRVRFRDYGFFVPLDAGGRPATVEGTAKVEVVSEAMRRHLAEDAGQPPEAVAEITGDVTTVQLVADAVQLCDAAGCAAPAVGGTP